METLGPLPFTPVGLGTLTGLLFLLGLGARVYLIERKTWLAEKAAMVLEAADKLAKERDDRARELERVHKGIERDRADAERSREWLIKTYQERQDQLSASLIACQGQVEGALGRLHKAEEEFSKLHTEYIALRETQQVRRRTNGQS